MMYRKSQVPWIAHRLLFQWNTANLRNLIAVTSLVILLKSDANHLIFSGRVILKFDRWPRKAIGHLLYATSSFVHHFIAIQTGVTVRKCSIRVKIIYFLAHVTLKLDGWSWKKKKNNRAHLLCNFKLCASFRSHLWIPTDVTVGKCLIQVEIIEFWACVTLKFEGWLWKQ